MLTHVQSAERQGRPTSDSANTWLIKRLMKLVENECNIEDYPILKLVYPRDSAALSQQEQERIMSEASKLTYQDEIQHPWDSYFGMDLAPLLEGRVALDLGCFTGGRSIAWYERYGLREICGIDVLELYVEAASRFAENRGSRASFVCGKGENIPFADDKFNAILSFDVFEHVTDVKSVLLECRRVLKKNGRLFAVFPSFYHPYEHHLSLVTLTPFLHYLFDGEELIKAYNDIVDERGTDKNWWYRRKSRELEEWERGNTINGMTKAQFRRLIVETNWIIYHEHNMPFLKTLAERHPVLRPIRYVLTPLAHLPGLEEMLCERIVYILEKP